MKILEYATKMEIDGEKFYKQQAANNKDSKLASVFMSLANDEKKHAEIIKEKLGNVELTLDEKTLNGGKNVFTNAEGLDYEKGFTEQSDIYEIALEMEAKSIDLYKNLLKNNPESTEIFDFLIAQEEKHYKLIEEMVVLVNRPNEWVESAEFGLRKDQY